MSPARGSRAAVELLLEATIVEPAGEAYCLARSEFRRGPRPLLARVGRGTVVSTLRRSPHPHERPSPRGSPIQAAGSCTGPDGDAKVCIGALTPALPPAQYANKHSIPAEMVP